MVPVAVVRQPGVKVQMLSKNTTGGTDYIVTRITMAPGTSTGWHYHPGEVFGYIAEGTMTHYAAVADSAEGCAVDGVYPPGAPIKEGTGPGCIHLGRNEGTVSLVMEIVYINPAGAPLAVAVPGPANCRFSDSAVT